MRAMVTFLFVVCVSACVPNGTTRGLRDVAAVPQERAAPPRLEIDERAWLRSPEATWQSHPVSAEARDVSAGDYVVQPGDTLRGIGNRTGAGSEAIAAANGLAPPYVIRPGQRLVIPAGRYHSVGEGETGIAIAQAYGVRWADMLALNGLEEPYILRVGQRLRLPDQASATSAAIPQSSRNGEALSLEARAAAFRIGIDEIVTGSQPALAEGRAASPPPMAKPSVPLNVALAEPQGFSGRFIWPLSGKILTPFGVRGGGQVNDGINIAAERETPVMASGPGVVAYAGDEIGVYGGLILINHGGGWVTAYGHLEKLNVVRGEKVRAGQAIGTVGQTGYVSRPQLHFEIRRDRRPVDPATQLPARS